MQITINEKKRLDIILAEAGLCESREKARALIMAGSVLVDGERQDKPGYQVYGSHEITLTQKQKYVSRGGFKLEKAVNEFSLDFSGLICMDVGASTGGFTDCMLQNGASKVYSIDVGYGQLAWKIRNDDRVINMERVNFRHLTKEQIKDGIDFASVDVSFISLSIILPVLHTFLKESAGAVILVKPQFEAGKSKVGKKGVVKDAAVHKEVLLKILDVCAGNGFNVINTEYSPIKGPEGNIEYLFYIKKNSGGENPKGLSESIKNIASLIERAHAALGKGI